MAIQDTMTDFLNPDRKRKKDPSDAVFAQYLERTFAANLPSYPLDSPFEQAQHYRGTVYLGIQFLMDALSGSTIGLEVKKSGDGEAAPGPQPTDDDYEPFEGHVLSDILRSPNPADSFSAFLSQCALQWHLFGRLLIWGAPNEENLPVRLYVIPTALATPAYGLGNDLYPRGAWRIQQYYPLSGLMGILPGPLSGTAGAVIDAREIYMIQNPHPLYKWAPMSPMVGVDTQNDAIEMVDRSFWSVMRQGIKPSGVLDLPGAGSSQVEAVQNRIDNLHGGPDNHGKIFVMGGGDPERPVAKFSQFAPTPNQMEFDNRDKYEGIVLAAVTGQDRGVCGLREGGGYAERWAAIQDVRIRKYEPWLSKVAGLLTRGPVRDWGLADKGVRVFIRMPKMQDPTLIQADTNAGAADGTMTVDEVRARRGMGPHPDPEYGKLPPSIAQQVLATELMPPEPEPGSAPPKKPSKSKGKDKKSSKSGPSRPKNKGGKGSLPPKGKRKTKSLANPHQSTVIASAASRQAHRATPVEDVLDAFDDVPHEAAHRLSISGESLHAAEAHVHAVDNHMQMVAHLNTVNRYSPKGTPEATARLKAEGLHRKAMRRHATAAIHHYVNSGHQHLADELFQQHFGAEEEAENKALDTTETKAIYQNPHDYSVGAVRDSKRAWSTSNHELTGHRFSGRHKPEKVALQASSEGDHIYAAEEHSEAMVLHGVMMEDVANSLLHTPRGTPEYKHRVKEIGHHREALLSHAAAAIQHFTAGGDHTSATNIHQEYFRGGEYRNRRVIRALDMVEVKAHSDYNAIAARAHEATMEAQEASGNHPFGSPFGGDPELNVRHTRIAQMALKGKHEEVANLHDTEAEWHRNLEEPIEHPAHIIQADQEQNRAAILAHTKASRLHRLAAKLKGMKRERKALDSTGAIKSEALIAPPSSGKKKRVLKGKKARAALALIHSRIMAKGTTLEDMKKAVHDNPTEHTTRLAYADTLEESEHRHHNLEAHMQRYVTDHTNPELRKAFVEAWGGEQKAARALSNKANELTKTTPGQRQTGMINMGTTHDHANFAENYAARAHNTPSDHEEEDARQWNRYASARHSDAATAHNKAARAAKRRGSHPSLENDHRHAALFHQAASHIHAEIGWPTESKSLPELPAHEVKS